MSKEERDCNSKRKQNKERGPIRESKRLRQKVDYSEIEVVPLDSEGERTSIQSESGIGSTGVDTRLTDETAEVKSSTRLWMPVTLRNTTSKVNEQYSRLREISMATEAEKSGMEKLMEMMLLMRADDKKEAQLREEKREREERQREVDRLDRAVRIAAQEKQKAEQRLRDELERKEQRLIEEHEREDRRIEREARWEEE